MSANPLDHVVDSNKFELFPTSSWLHEIHLPNIFGFQITKFMVLELVAAGLIIGIYVPLAKRMRDGSPPKGLFANAFESILTFIRENVAKPYLHGHDADRFLPFLWTLFLFILFCNLLGMFPFLGSPTAALDVTAALAIIAFCVIFFAPMFEHGPVKFFKSFVPHADMAGWIKFLGIPILLMVAVIEVFGIFIKAFVLAVRLFANMFAGHTVLAMILMFTQAVKDENFFKFMGVSVAASLGIVILSLLELFVAFLQAFVFTFLTALFLGSTMHPEH